MFKKIIELIKDAIRKMVQYQTLDETLANKDIYTISDKMLGALELWEEMYQDKSPWLSDYKGVYSLGLAPFICSTLTTHILNEFKSNILSPDEDVKDIDESKNTESNTRASYLNEVYHRNLLGTLNDNLEHALAVGGMIVKPYVNNGEVFYNYVMQGEFVPLGFTDDGVINDIAFYDDFVDGSKRYRKVERHVFDPVNKTCTVYNNAYVATVQDVTDKGVELGNPIPLEQVPRWKDIQEETIIQDVEKPLYGYFRVAKANNIDSTSPLGISIFSRAIKTIERADMQYSRLDWEYEGGQMAVDIDITAVKANAEAGVQDQLRERLYRGVDVGKDDTYNVFAPNLRDTQYTSGLNTYLMRIEDLCEISRGTISSVQSEARTATELKILQQRSYSTITRNQRALEKCLDDVIYATNTLVALYNLAPQGDYNTTHEWSDNVLVDTDVELTQRIQLLSVDVMSKAEVRAWYCGEDIETAQAQIDKINNEKMQLMDLFSANTDEPQGLEDDGEEKDNPFGNQDNDNTNPSDNEDKDEE